MKPNRNALLNEIVDRVAREVVRANPLAWQSDLLLLAMQRAPGVPQSRLLEAVRRAKTAETDRRASELLASLRGPVPARDGASPAGSPAEG